MVASSLRVYMLSGALLALEPSLWMKNDCYDLAFKETE